MYDFIPSRRYRKVFPGAPEVPRLPIAAKPFKFRLYCLGKEKLRAKKLAFAEKGFSIDAGLHNSLPTTFDGASMLFGSFIVKRER